MAQRPKHATNPANTQSDAIPHGALAMRIKSEDLLRQAREVKIDHQSRIYRLRLTQLNKLILTA